MLPLPTIQAFDAHLADLGLHFEAVVIGGSALALLGIVSRPTKDFDVMEPELPAAIQAAARAFAEQQRRHGNKLGDDWLNNGPMQLGSVLPSGWQSRLQTIFVGRAIVLTSLGRADLLKSKLFALCDRGTDLADCVALAPTSDEITEALPWLVDQDANPDWPAHVRATVRDLQGRLGHVVSSS